MVPGVPSQVRGSTAVITRRQLLGGALAVFVFHHRPGHTGGPAPTPPPPPPPPTPATFFVGSSLVGGPYLLGYSG
jgi:hypothetical protein